MQTRDPKEVTLLPIIDVHIVRAAQTPETKGLAKRMADVLGHLFGAQPGHVWVRLHILPAEHYAENQTIVATPDLPVFVTVLHARPPKGQAREEEVVAITRAIAECLNRAPGRVHVEYAAKGAGRVAFGGKLL